MEILVILVAAAFVAILGIAIGMLVARRLDRWAAPPERRPEDADANDH